jgi:chromosome segregation ATPase
MSNETQPQRSLGEIAMTMCNGGLSESLAMEQGQPPATDDHVKEQEWTPEQVMRYFPDHAEALAKAINAALAAERERIKRQQHYIKHLEACVANMPKGMGDLTREWLELREQLAAEREQLDTVRELRELDQKALANEREKREQAEQDLDAAETLGILLTKNFASQLAAKKEYIDEIRTTTYSDLEKQLAAERKKVENLHSILGKKRVEIQQLKEQLAAALAKVT